MLRRIIANLLILTALLPLCLLSVSANDATTITQWDGTIPVSGVTVASGENFASTTDLTSPKRTFIVRAATYGYGSGVSSAVEGDNSYLVVNHSYLRSNYRSLVSTWLTNDNPVASVRYNIRIPAGDDYTNSKRSFTFNFVTAEGSSIVNPTAVTVTYQNRKFSASATETSSKTTIAGTLNTADYTPGEWVAVEVRGYRTSNNTLNIGVYVGKNQIFYGEGTSTVYTGDLGINQIDITQSKFSTEDETSYTTYTTHYDDITIAAVGAEYIPSDFSIVNSIIDIDFSDVSETEATTLGAASTGKFLTPPAGIQHDSISV